MPEKIVKVRELPDCCVCGRKGCATHDSYVLMFRRWGYTCTGCFELHGVTGGFYLEVYNVP